MKSAVLGLPLAILDGAVSPYIDPKAWALHLLAAAAVVAWAFHRGSTADHGATPEDDATTRMLRWAVLAYAAWWLVATAASVTLGASLWGNFGRADGLLTRLAAVAFYFLVRSRFRPAAATVVDLTLLGSVPVVMIALGQALGWDPMPAAGDPASPVRSTFGQHVFLGGYLALVIPLAAARLAGASHDGERDFRGGPDGSTRSFVAAGGFALGAWAIAALAAGVPPVGWICVPWAVAAAVLWTVWVEPAGAPVKVFGIRAVLIGLLMAHALTIVVSGARGALLGTLVGLAVMAGALLVRARAWRALAGGGAAAAVVLVVILLLSLPGSPLRGIGRQAPWAIDRLAMLSDVERSSGRFRIKLWQTIASAWVTQIRGHEVIAGTSPRIRSVFGYGPESQLAILDRLGGPDRAGGKIWIDRAHNEILDHLVTGGLVGAGLWLVVVSAVVGIGLRRFRQSTSPVDARLRAGCLGAIVAHVVDAQLGIATPVSRALFWIVAGVLVSPATGPPAPSSTIARARPAAADRSRLALAIAVATLAVLTAGASTRWIMASLAYAEGSRRRVAGDLSAAHREFRRAQELVPGLSQPADAVVGIAFSLALSEPDPARRQTALAEAQDALAHVRRYSSYARNHPNHWALVGRIALARARGGENGEVMVAVEAYATAARLAPGDASILANLGLAWLETRRFAPARETAERAVALDPDAWLGWAVLANASARLGDATRATEATARARQLAPATASGLLAELLP